MLLSFHLLSSFRSTGFHILWTTIPWIGIAWRGSIDTYKKLLDIALRRAHKRRNGPYINMCYRHVTNAQTWTVVLPTLRQAHTMGGQHERLIPRCYSSSRLHVQLVGTKPALNIWPKLTKAKTYGLVPNAECLESTMATQSEHPQGGSALVSQPVEILSQIAGYLEKKDAIRLGLTCHFLMRLVLDFIKLDLSNEPGYWVGQPLAVIGNWTESLPDSFLHNEIAYNSAEPEYLPELTFQSGTCLTSAVNHILARDLARSFMGQAYTQ